MYQILITFKEVDEEDDDETGLTVQETAYKASAAIA